MSDEGQTVDLSPQEKAAELIVNHATDNLAQMIMTLCALGPAVTSEHKEFVIGALEAFRGSIVQEIVTSIEESIKEAQGDGTDNNQKGS